MLHCTAQHSAARPHLQPPTSNLSPHTHQHHRRHPQVPLDSPDRFLVEVLFSNGANFDPTRVVPLANDHTLPVVPRAPLHTGIGVPLTRLTALLDPCAAQRKSAPSTYALQVALRAPLSSQLSSQAPSRTLSGMITAGSALGSGSALSASGMGSGSNLAALAQQASGGGKDGGGKEGMDKSGGETAPSGGTLLSSLSSGSMPICGGIVGSPGAM